MDALVGIPGTISAEAKGIRWIRYADTPEGHRTYQAKVKDGWLSAIVSRDPAGERQKLLWHISISHRDENNIQDRCPNWDEIKHAAYRLIPEDVCLVLIFPRRTAPYVNLHDTCLHLWESEKGIDL